jgi:hypothetical protein
MSWTRKLKAPIVLDGGRALVTLADAPALIAGLLQRHLGNGYWQAAPSNLSPHQSA